MSDETASCPVCKSNSYLNPHLKLLVSSCYHKLCDLCVNRIFSQGSSTCPTCKTVTLRKSNFTVPFFEDLVVEKEVRIRRLISGYLNKREEDFEDLKSYNDYLEHVEDIAFNLLNDINVKETFNLLEEMKTKDADLLVRNIQKQQHEEQQITSSLQSQIKLKQARREHDLFEFKREQVAKQRYKEELINELANSDDPAIAILSKRGSLKQSSMKEQLTGKYEGLLVDRTREQLSLRSKRSLLEELQTEQETKQFDPMLGVVCWESPIAFEINFAKNQWNDKKLLDWSSEPMQRASGVRYEIFIHFMINSAFGGLKL